MQTSPILWIQYEYLSCSSNLIELRWNWNSFRFKLFDISFAANATTYWLRTIRDLATESIKLSKVTRYSKHNPFFSDKFVSQIILKLIWMCFTFTDFRVKYLFNIFLLTVDISYMSKGAIILALKNKNKFEDIFETPPYVYTQGGLFII